NGYRLIEHPFPELKAIQRRINRLIQRLQLPNVFHGCYAATSILTNASHHRVSSWYLTFDLANYYKTIRPQKVYLALTARGAAPDVARTLTRLTTIKGRVPQGAPTSPVIAILAMCSMARRMQILVQRMHGTITIFGDNVSVSGPKGLISQ